MNKATISSVLIGLTFSAVSAHAACPAGTESRGVVAGKERCALKGKYLSTALTLTADNEYVLEDGVFFGGDNKESSVLRLQAGTVVRGAPGSFLAIMRGSKIFAWGTKEKPVVFTSLKTTGRKRGDWGGLVLNGNAPINACAGSAPVCEAISEGIKVEQVKFGGNNAEDSSGSLRYVRVEFGGYPISQDNELNGISFNGVGRGTEVDHVQVHMNGDDGVEFFGGTVSVKHLVLTDNEDDSLDWDMGWTGKGQFIIMDQGAGVADNGIEADNLKSPMNAEPRSNPELSNVTMIGSPASAYGLLLRRGTAGHLTNSIVTGFGKACVDIDDTETFNYGATVAGHATGLKMSNTVLNCKKGFEEEAGDGWSVKSWFLAQAGNKETDPQLKGWMPTRQSIARSGGQTPDDLFFDPVDYIGAMSSQEGDWTAGWTSRAAE